MVQVKEDAEPVRESDDAETPADDSTDDLTETPAPAHAEASAPAAKPKREVRVSLRGAVLGAVIAVLVVALATMTWLYFDERSTVQAQIREADDHRRAEQVALDYAVGAAAMNFQDLNSWKGRLVAGTSPELSEKLNKAADSMQQLLIPLEWNSTSEPLTAKVRSADGGIYVVDTFVSVLTKTTQAPDNLQSTATYSVTIDSNNDWVITDVGGIGAVVGGR